MNFKSLDLYLGLPTYFFCINYRIILFCKIFLKSYIFHKHVTKSDFQIKWNNMPRNDKKILDSDWPKNRPISNLQPFLKLNMCHVTPTYYLVTCCDIMINIRFKSELFFFYQLNCKTKSLMWHSYRFNLSQVKNLWHRWVVDHHFCENHGSISNNFE